MANSQDKKGKEEKRRVRRGGGLLQYGTAYVVNPIRRSLVRGVLKLFGLLVGLGLLLLLLSGVINQAKTGETLVQYTMNVGYRVSEFIDSIMQGGGPLKFDGGIYFKDANPPDDGVLPEPSNAVDIQEALRGNDED